MTTTRSILLGSLAPLRALVSSTRHGRLAGAASGLPDRDLDRMAADLLHLAQADAAPHPRRTPAPVDLDARRARSSRPVVTATHARAS